MMVLKENSAQCGSWWGEMNGFLVWAGATAALGYILVAAVIGALAS